MQSIRCGVFINPEIAVPKKRSQSEHSIICVQLVSEDTISPLLCVCAIGYMNHNH
jgi:hypothetical protein